MEANEAHELQEHAEHGAHESTLWPVAFTMSVLAVLVAVTTVLGHRTHTGAAPNQSNATDHWHFGIVFALSGIASALSALLLK